MHRGSMDVPRRAQRTVFVSFHNFPPFRHKLPPAVVSRLYAARQRRAQLRNGSRPALRDLGALHGILIERPCAVPLRGDALSADGLCLVALYPSATASHAAGFASRGPSLDSLGRVDDTSLLKEDIVWCWWAVVHFWGRVKQAAGLLLVDKALRVRWARSTGQLCTRYSIEALHVLCVHHSAVLELQGRSLAPRG